MKQIKQIMMVIMLMTGIFTSCEMMHEDIPECNRVILKFNNVTANDTDTFGLYVLSKNDIIIEGRQIFHIYPLPFNSRWNASQGR